MTDKLLLTIKEAVDSQRDFYLSGDKVVRRPWMGRLWRGIRPDAYSGQDRAIARLLTEKVTASQALPWCERLGAVYNHPAIDTAQRFYMQHQTTIKASAEGKALRLAVNAAKADLPEKVLEDHPDFVVFLEKNHLHRYLVKHGHHIGVTDDGEPTLLRKGVMVPWSDLKATLDITGGKFSGRYSKEGLIDQDAYNWTKLEPFIVEDPDNWGRRYIFEFCSWAQEEPTLLNNHSWIRLRTPEGEVYSVGSFPFDKGQPWARLRFPLRVRKGELMSPDVSECWKGAYYALQVEVTKEQFLAMKRTVEEDKVGDQLTYHIFHDNCTSYANKILAVAKVRLPTHVPLFTMTAPKPIRNACRWIYESLPSFVQKVIAAIGTVVFNIFAIFAGYTVVDKVVQAWKREEIKPTLNHIRDLPNPRLAGIDHPYTVAYQIRNEVDKWRETLRTTLEYQRNAHEQKLKNQNMVERAREGIVGRLRDIKERLKALPYRLPPKYYVAVQ